MSDKKDKFLHSSKYKWVIDLDFCFHFTTCGVETIETAQTFFSNMSIVHDHKI